MNLAEIKENLRTLSRYEKFHLIQFLTLELSQEEQLTACYFKTDNQQGFWSQYNAFEAANELQTLLKGNKT